jgi:hypothetical protein
MSKKETGRESIEACSPVLRQYPFIFLKWWEWVEVKAQLRTVDSTPQMLDTLNVQQAR